MRIGLILSYTVICAVLGFFGQVTLHVNPANLAAPFGALISGAIGALIAYIVLFLTERLAVGRRTSIVLYVVVLLLLSLFVFLGTAFKYDIVSRVIRVKIVSCEPIDALLQNAILRMEKRGSGSDGLPPRNLPKDWKNNINTMRKNSDLVVLRVKVLREYVLEEVRWKNGFVSMRSSSESIDDGAEVFTANYIGGDCNGYLSSKEEYFQYVFTGRPFESLSTFMRAPMLKPVDRNKLWFDLK